MAVSSESKQEFVTHTCVTRPSSCKNGGTMAAWIKCNQPIIHPRQFLITAMDPSGYEGIQMRCRDGNRYVQFKQVLVCLSWWYLQPAISLIFSSCKMFLCLYVLSRCQNGYGSISQFQPNRLAWLSKWVIWLAESLVLQGVLENILPGLMILIGTSADWGR